MKTIPVTLFLLLAFLHGPAQTNISGGNVSGLWTLAGSPYLVNGHILVPDDSTLTLEAGVSVIFTGHYKLFCNGRILAEGNANDSIRFSAADTSTGWLGFRFDNTPPSNDSSVFSYCSIQNGKATGTGNDVFGGAFYFAGFSKCRISNSCLENNFALYGGGAIYCAAASPLIIKNEFKKHGSYNGGNGIECTNSSPVIAHNLLADGTSIVFYTSDPVIRGNTIIRNFQGGITGFGGNAVIDGNSIQYNTNLNGGGGGGILLYGCNTTISNNLISNNTTKFMGGGIAIASGGTDNIFNNIIVNNYTDSIPGGNGNGGGGVSCYNSSPKLTNNTICNNYSARPGGGIACSYSSNPVIKNCIVYGNVSTGGNGNNVFLEDNPSDPSITYSTVEGGLAGIYANGNPYTGSFAGSIDADPLFLDPTAAADTLIDAINSDWRLNYLSPCINTGSPTGPYPALDFGGLPRINGSAIDMGAHEYQECVSYFTVMPDTVPHSWIIVNHSQGAAPVDYLWDWGDGSTSTGAVPVHTYANAGNYYICLTVTDAAGCSSQFCDSTGNIFKLTSVTPVQITVVWPSAVSVQENMQAVSGMQAYPVPASDRLYIKNAGGEKVYASLYNSVGQNVMNHFISRSNDYLPVGDLNEGIYFLRLQSEAEEATQVIVIRR